MAERIRPAGRQVCHWFHRDRQVSDTMSTDQENELRRRAQAPWLDNLCRELMHLPAESARAEVERIALVAAAQHTRRFGGDASKLQADVERSALPPGWKCYSKQLQ